MTRNCGNPDSGERNTLNLQLCPAASAFSVGERHGQQIWIKLSHHDSLAFSHLELFEIRIFGCKKIPKHRFHLGIWLSRYSASHESMSEHRCVVMIGFQKSCRCKIWRLCDSSLGQSFDAYYWFGPRADNVPIVLKLALDAYSSVWLLFADFVIYYLTHWT